MAKKKWIVLPNGRIKRWKKRRTELRPGGGTTKWWKRVPPRWFRNYLNRRERRKVMGALFKGEADCHLYIHPREAGWYW